MIRAKSRVMSRAMSRVMSRPTAFALALACAAPGAGPAAGHGLALDPAVEHHVTTWDGARTAAGLWFAIDGEPPRGRVVLSVVRHIPQGLEIRAVSGRLVLSADLAAHLGLEPHRPTLIALTREDDPDPPALAAHGAAAPQHPDDPLALGSDDPRALAAEAGIAARDADAYAALTAHIARIDGLFGAMRADADRAEAAAVGLHRPGPPEPAPQRAAPRRGGLVAYGWEAAP